MHNTRQCYIRQLISACILASMLMTISCGPPRHVVKVDGLIPEQITLSESHDGTVMLQVEGGRETHSMGLYQIPNSEFLTALKTAVEKSGVFSSVAGTDGADFQLMAFIFNISQPFFVKGDVTVEVAWTLAKTDTGEVLWQEAIKTNGNGIAAEGKSYNKRVAIEQAANENIKQAIERLSRVTL